MIKEKLISILVNVFGVTPESISDIPYLALKMGAIDEWDSLGNLDLLLAIEAEFSVRFSAEELSSLQSLKDIEHFLVVNSEQSDQQ